MKKLLLAVLPAITLLASCSGQPKVNVANAMVEDTLAHEEIFGALPEFEQDDKLVRKQLPDSGLWTPVLGFQDKDNGDGTTSIRIVAAVQGTVTTVTWTRCVHNIYGTVVTGKEKDNIEVTTIYEKLQEDDDSLTWAKDVEELDDEAGTKPFGYYAVYCLLNVPSKYAHNYVNAFVTISDGEHTTKSCGAVVNVADSNDVYYYSILGTDRNAGFINKIARESDSLGESQDLFCYKPISFSTNDTLEAFWINESNLTISKNTDAALGDAFDGMSFNDETKTVTFTKDAKYNVYFNGSSQYWFDKYTSIYLTFDFSPIAGYKPVPENFKVHAYNSANPNGVYSWASAEELLTQVDDTWEYTYTIECTGGNITGFNVIFYQGVDLKQSVGAAAAQTLEAGHSYRITVNPSSWWGDNSGKFEGGITVTPLA